MTTAQETDKADSAELHVEVDVVVPHGVFAATVASSGGLTVRTRIQAPAAPRVPESIPSNASAVVETLRAFFNARRNAVDLLAKQMHNTEFVSAIPLDLARGTLDAVQAERDAIDAMMKSLPAPAIATPVDVRDAASGPSAQGRSLDPETVGQSPVRDEDAAAKKEPSPADVEQSNPVVAENPAATPSDTADVASTGEPLDMETDGVEKLVSALMRNEKCWKSAKLLRGGGFILISSWCVETWSVQYDAGQLLLRGKVWYPLFRMGVCRFLDDDCAKSLVVKPECLPKFLRALWKVNDRSVHGDPASPLCAALAVAFVRAKTGKSSHKRGTVDAAGFAAFVADTSFYADDVGSIVGRPKTQGPDRAAAVHRVKMGCRLSRGRGGRALVLLLPADRPGPLDLYEACTLYEHVRETRDEKLYFVEYEALEVARLLLLHGDLNEGAKASLVRFVFDWRGFEHLEF